MSDVPRSLSETLNELHRQLDEVVDLDESTRSEIRETVVEIREALDASSGPAQSSLRDRVAKVLERFEGSHPTLVAAINRVADQLSELGI